MTLKSYLTELYGGRIYHLTTVLKNVKCKLARLTNHTTFLIRCRDNQIVPNGMRLRRVFSSVHASKILRKAEETLIRDQIVSLRQRKAAEIKTKERLLLSLRNTMSGEDFRTVQEVTDKAENNVFHSTKATQRKKFDALVATKKRSARSGRSITVTAVDNRSGRDLTEDELNVLKKGLGFAPAPEIIPEKEIICAVEASLSKVTDDKANIIRSQVSNVLTKAKKQPVKDNLTVRERKALGNLKKRSDIKILPADKGNVTVVLSTEEYKRKVAELLNDPAYVKIQRDPTAVKERKMKQVIEDIRRSGDMSDELAKKLKPNHSTAPRLYGLPKVHKEGTPLRPITCMIGSPAYEAAAYLTNVISPVLGKSVYTVSNSSSFVDEIKRLNLNEFEEMVSFDVVSLFTKVPVQEAVDVICKKLSEDDTLFERSELGVDTIRKLMMACLECRYFLCHSEFYEQKEGAPMGLSLSVVLANAYMEHLEESVLNTCALKPTIWRRYVDDTFILWPHGEDALQEFHRQLNDFCPDVQFTLEREKENQMSFLDVLLCREDGRLKTSVYRKATTSNVYLNFASNHPPGTKAGIIKCLETRARLICSDPSKLKEEKDMIREVFAANGYPEEFIKKAMRPKRNVQSQEPQEEASGRQVYAAIPYVPGVSEKISKILKQGDIRVAHKSKRLRNQLVRVKDPIEPGKRKGAVYQITCSCGSSYVGESGRPKNVRMKEHIADMKFARTDKSATAKHFETCGGNMNPLDGKVLALECHWKKRKIREAIEIRELRPSINLDIGTVTLSPIWDVVLKRNGV